MTTPIFNLEMEQGAYWTHTFNWYGGGKQMAPIEDVVEGYPTIIRVTAHGLPTVSDTPVIVSGVEGVLQLNSTDTGIELATRIDADTFSVPVSTVGEIATPGKLGEITWYAPSVITGYTGRCQIRKNWHTTNFIAELTTANGGLVIVEADASFQLILSAAATAAFDFVDAVYDIEAVPPGGGDDVVRILKGNIHFDREMTR